MSGGLPEGQRERRGHDFYPSPGEALPALYSTEATPAAEKIVVAHYFVGSADWWLVEYDPDSGDGFGYACLCDPQNAEWGYIPLVELEAIGAGPGGWLVVERDLHWTPVPFAEVRHACEGGRERP